MVLAALKQHTLKQQAAKQQQQAFRSGRTEKYWHILNNFEQYWQYVQFITTCVATSNIEQFCTISSNFVQNWQYVHFIRTRAICAVCTILKYIEQYESSIVINFMYNIEMCNFMCNEQFYVKCAILVCNFMCNIAQYIA